MHKEKKYTTVQNKCMFAISHYVCCVCSNIDIQSMNLIYIYDYTEYIIVIEIIFLLELVFLNKNSNNFELNLILATLFTSFT